jgi:hypothetical protein
MKHLQEPHSNHHIRQQLDYRRILQKKYLQSTNVRSNKKNVYALVYFSNIFLTFRIWALLQWLTCNLGSIMFHRVWFF